MLLRRRKFRFCGGVCGGFGVHDTGAQHRRVDSSTVESSKNTVVVCGAGSKYSLLCTAVYTVYSMLYAVLYGGLGERGARSKRITLS